MYPILQIRPGFQKRFMAGYPWAYANEIVQSNLTKELEPGELVQIEYSGKPIATGYFNRHSLISFRTLSRLPLEKIDVSFFKQQLSQALSLRQAFYSKPYYRLVHAEADNLPGLIIDRFDTVFVIQINTQGMEKLREPLLQALQELFEPTTLYLKLDSKVREQESLSLLEPVIIGAAITHLTVIENATEFSIDLSSSQKTGWFFDHQENRKMMAELSKDKSVIDYFCYSGGFSLQAAKQAASVVGIDASEPALENARRSAALNKVSERTQFICSDVFKDLDERLQRQETFDIVILDPPAFVKTKKDLVVGLKGYEKLLNKAIHLVANNGFLMIASCSYHVRDADLKICLARALSKNQRAAKIVRSLTAGPDHPLHPLLEESSYLKGFLVSL